MTRTQFARLLLSVDPSDISDIAVEVAADPEGGVSFFDALTNQSGSKLEMRRRVAPVVVIDHRIEEKPTEN